MERIIENDKVCDYKNICLTYVISKNMGFNEMKT